MHHPIQTFPEPDARGTSQTPRALCLYDRGPLRAAPRPSTRRGEPPVSQGMNAMAN